MLNKSRSIQRTDQSGMEVKAPPGQYVTEKFPVFSYGSTPKIDMATWKFKIFGMLDEEVIFSWRQFMALPKIVVEADFHCVTQWSRLNNIWEGVSIGEVMKLVKPKPNAKFIMVHCYGGYTTNLKLTTFLEEQVLFAYRHDGKELGKDHGGPLRLVVPQLYGWKSAKWVKGLEFIEYNSPGFWEARGYSMTADPWKEERFWPELG